MRQSELTESVIQVASELKEQASSLFDAYLLLPQLIDKEHRVIKAVDFTGVAAVGEEKALLSDKIEKAFNAMVGIGERIAVLQCRLNGAEAPQRLATLKECVAALVDLAPRLDAGLGAQVLKYQIDGLKRLVQGFDEKIPDVKPKIEANKVLLQVMLESYQESYRFWLSVAEETISSYNSHGVQKSTGRASAFRVRA